MNQSTHTTEARARARGRLQLLKSNLRQLPSALVPLTGSTASALLLLAAQDVLKEQAHACINRSSHIAAQMTAASVALCARCGIHVHYVDVDPLALDAFAENPFDRCAIYRRGLMDAARVCARRYGLAQVLDPRMDTAGCIYEEQLDAAPLLDAQMDSADVTILAQDYGIPAGLTTDMGLYASRFPYGTRLTHGDFVRVEQAENVLLQCGFEQVRVRVHADVARIEVDPASFEQIMQPDMRTQILQRLHQLGYSFVALDLDGYRPHSMDEPLA